MNTFSIFGFVLLGVTVGAFGNSVVDDIQSSNYEPVDAWRWRISLLVSPALPAEPSSGYSRRPK
jgi:hypothetical protein